MGAKEPQLQVGWTQETKWPFLLASRVSVFGSPTSWHAHPKKADSLRNSYL